MRLEQRTSEHLIPGHRQHMRNVSSHRFSLGLAILLHVILFSALFIHFASPDTRNLQLQPDIDIIKAVAVNPADVAAVHTQINAQQQQKRHEAEEALKQQQQQQQQEQQRAQAVKRQKEAEAAAEQKAVQQAQKQAQQKAEAAALLEQQQAEQKVLQQKQAQKAVVKKQQTEEAAVETKKITEEKTQQEATKKQQKAAEELKLAQQKELQNQMAAEKKQLEAARTNQEQSEIDKFTALILHTMRQNWVVPEGVNPTISSQLAIHLGPDGTVISVTLLRSSGNAALDNSARLAVFKSSPLPVPADKALFNEVFRQFNLTVSPKDIG